MYKVSADKKIEILIHNRSGSEEEIQRFNEIKYLLHDYEINAFIECPGWLWTKAIDKYYTGGSASALVQIETETDKAIGIGEVKVLDMNTSPPIVVSEGNVSALMRHSLFRRLVWLPKSLLLIVQRKCSVDELDSE